MSWFSTSVKANSSRVLLSVISVRTCSTNLACWLKFPKYAVVWVGCVLLYAVWASVKWFLKLGNIWSADGLASQCSMYSENMPTLVIIILPMMMS